MKRITRHLLSSVLAIAMPVAALADTSVESTTIVRYFQDDRAGFSTKDMAPITQFLGADFDKLGDGNLSLHLYGWGRMDLGDKSFNNDRADGSLTYGFLKYRFNHANAQIRAGRLFVTEGIVNEQIDGVSARTELPMGFGISAFGGATVHTADISGENTDGKGDGIYGGRLNYRYGGKLELGVSGLYETKAPSFSQVKNRSMVNNGKFGDHKLIGGDIWLAPHSMVEFMGRTSYNTETDAVAEHSYQLNLKPVKDLVLTGEFNEYRDRSYFYSSPVFSSMYSALRDRSRVIGAIASYGLNSQTELSADYRHYTREIGNADRMGAELSYRFKGNDIRTGAGYHYLRAGSGFAAIPSSTTSASFHELRGYIMRDAKKYFASADAIAYVFEKEIAGKKSAWEVITSVGYRFTPAIALSGDISYGQSPEYNDDLKGLLRLTYNMSYSSKGGAK
ncbi:hypothetical protein [Pelotalea chapellei]|uniref:Outer membrane OprD family porin n=1 Tax=Pelotalea chapellei TaxID=44671 RepID=A0ABS5U9A7_9BACT|nr:hypothetical protein [Pelotalea chapellei]MBT1072229.1 hypothetical protein [Pelotalea chapellei]